ncbi:MAG: hypothetical protein ABIG89_05995 [Candidatus Woesearchaeota archaeon]
MTKKRKNNDSVTTFLALIIFIGIILLILYLNQTDLVGKATDDIKSNIINKEYRETIILSIFKYRDSDKPKIRLPNIIENKNNNLKISWIERINQLNEEDIESEKKPIFLRNSALSETLSDELAGKAYYDEERAKKQERYDIDKKTEEKRGISNNKNIGINKDEQEEENKDIKKSVSWTRGDEKLNVYEKCIDDYECGTHLCSAVSTETQGYVKMCVPCDIGFILPNKYLNSETYYDCSSGECKKIEKIPMYNEKKCVQGTSGNNGFICNFDHVCELVGIHSKKTEIHQPELTDEELQKYKNCVTEICYDTEKPWSEFTQGTVYVRRAATDMDLADPEIPIFDNKGDMIDATTDNINKEGGLWTCDAHPDYCKDGNIIEFYCGYQNTENYGVLNILKYPVKPIKCKCGCKKGACIPEPCLEEPVEPVKKPDLIIQTVSNELHYQECESFIKFNICNIGDAPVTEKFVIEVSSGEEKEDIIFNPKNYAASEADNEEDNNNIYLEDGELKPNQCVELTNLEQLSLEDLGMIYANIYEVEVFADESEEIDEHNEDNNENKAAINTGLNYYDGEEYCIAECGCIVDEETGKGKCLPCPKYPDLVVSKIYPEAYSDKCVNSYKFKICNIGDAALEDNFWIIVSANGIDSTFEFDIDEYLELDGKLDFCEINDFGECIGDEKGCVVVSEPRHKLKQEIFGGKLGETDTITISLDIYSLNPNKHNLIEEKDENNNIAAGDIINSDNYYYDVEKTDVCDTWCYDTDNDGGIDPGDPIHYGELTYLYHGVIYNSNYYETPKESNKDLCNPYDDNKINLHEKMCAQNIIKYVDTDKLSNPFKANNVNCRDMMKTKCAADGTECGGKCLNGECIELPKDYLSCTDYESTTNMFFKGYIEYIDVDGNPKKDDTEQKPTNVPEVIYDKCGFNEFGNPEYLDEIYCMDEALKETQKINCYKVKTPEGKGHICEDGKCVVTDEDNEDCWDEPGNGIMPYEDLGYVTEILLYSFIEKRKHHNYCFNWNEWIRMPYCEGKYVAMKDYDCSKDGAKCVYTENGAKCTMPFQEPFCEDKKDGGKDYYKKGYINYEDEYGLGGNEWDYCDGNILIETYCANNKPIMNEEYNCAEEGMLCSYDACVMPSEENLECTEEEIPIYHTKESWVYGIDVFGNEYYLFDTCLNKYQEETLKGYDYLTEDLIYDIDNNKGEKLIELYCGGDDGKKLSYELVMCNDVYGTEDKTFSCKEGACKEKNMDWTDCYSDPDNENKIIYVDEFGDEIDRFAYCPEDMHGEIPVCIVNEDGYNDYMWVDNYCKDGEKCINGLCKPYGEETCKQVDENHILFTNGWNDAKTIVSLCEGEDDNINNDDVNPKIIKKPVCCEENDQDKQCADKPYKFVIDNCPEETECYGSYWNEVEKLIEEAVEEKPNNGGSSSSEEAGEGSNGGADGDIEEEEPVEEPAPVEEVKEETEVIEIKTVTEYKPAECKQTFEPKCEQADENHLILTDKWGDTWQRFIGCNDNINMVQYPVCCNKNNPDENCDDLSDYDDDGKYGWKMITCSQGYMCNQKTNKCEEQLYDEPQCIQVEPNFVKIINIFGDENMKIAMCDAGDQEFTKVICDNIKDKKYDLVNVECDLGFGCNPATMECQELPEPEKDLTSCTGPQGWENIDTNTKEKTIALDMFGNELFIITDDGQKFNEDFCPADFYPEYFDKDEIIEFWCDGNELESDDINCLNGKICEDGACV